MMSKNVKSTNEEFNSSFRNDKYKKIEINNAEDLAQVKKWFSMLIGENTELELMRLLYSSRTKINSKNIT